MFSIEKKTRLLYLIVVLFLDFFFSKKCKKKQFYCELYPLFCILKLSRLEGLYDITQ